MKKLLLPLLFIITTTAFSQDNAIKYFGGIYDNQLYFNWVLHNEDTCYYLIELSDDGESYYKIKSDYITPMVVAVMHSIKIPACGSELCVRVIAKMNGVILEYQPEIFEEGKYTKTSNIKPMKGRVIHANF